MSESNQLVLSNPRELLAYLQKSKSAISMALPKHLNADRMLRLAVTSFSTNPGLRRCTPISILSSLVVASQLGLEPGIGGQGYLIPFKTTCTFVPGWQGLVGLLNNTGRATAWTGMVFEGDEMDFELGGTPKLRHKPGKNFGDPNMMTWVYACGKVNGAEQTVIECWPIKRVWEHRDKYNKVGSKHYSFEHPEMYARKVVLLQVLKYMPRSIELNNALAASNAAEIGNSCRVEDGVVIEVQSSEPEPEVKVSVSDVAQSQPAPSTAPQTPQVKLESFVIGAGFTIDEFKKWGADSGNVPSADEIATFSDVHEVVAERLLRSKMGLREGLSRWTGRAPKE